MCRCLWYTTAKTLIGLKTWAATPVHVYTVKMVMYECSKHRCITKIGTAETISKTMITKVIVFSAERSLVGDRHMASINTESSAYLH